MLITANVLDFTCGRPVNGLPVVLEHRAATGWHPIAAAQTDESGDVTAWSAPATEPGLYRLAFDTGEYFDANGVASRYTEVTITVLVTAVDTTTHVGLLLSPSAYSTYQVA